MENGVAALSALPASSYGLGARTAATVRAWWTTACRGQATSVPLTDVVDVGAGPDRGVYAVVPACLNRGRLSEA